MDVVVQYPTGGLVNNDITAPATLNTSETQVFLHNHLGALRDSQYTVYLAVTLGAVASATFYYYWTPLYNGASTVWYPVCLYNTSTGQEPRRAVVIDSTAYSTGGVSLAVDELPVGSSTAFQITAISATGTPSYSVNVMRRNN